MTFLKRSCSRYSSQLTSKCLYSSLASNVLCYDKISPLTRAERYNPSPSPTNTNSVSFRKKHDVIIIGAGHNGLTAAAYLAKAGLDVLVLERRNMVGGAAITEEVFPGYKFSRASYLAGLLRPQVLQELRLQSHYNLEFLQRNPTSFTPTTLDNPQYQGKYLMFWNGDESYKTIDSIAQFSVRDARKFVEYEAYLGNIRQFLQPLLDDACPDLVSLMNFDVNATTIKQLMKLRTIKSNLNSSQTVFDLMQLMTSSANKILNSYFESDILKATLATDSVIGSTLSPADTGSAYVLLHHVMGEVEQQQGVWAYVKGGMGEISNALKSCCLDNGVKIECNAEVSRIVTKIKNESLQITGVQMMDGTTVECKYLLSNATPYHTFVDLVDNNPMPNINRNRRDPNAKFLRDIKNTNYDCGAFKINLVVDKLPDFECLPNRINSKTGNAQIDAQHRGTIHFESQMSELEIAAEQSKQGIPADRPIIEMTIPSSLDNTLVKSERDQKKGHHVVQLFVQAAPYDLNYEVLGVKSWDDLGGDFKRDFVEKRVFKIVDEFCCGQHAFSDSILHYDALSPRDLEKIYGLYKGNIFHGAMSLDQIGYGRPVTQMSGGYKTPIENLYICGSGAHPGGGVMGAPGRNCANFLIENLKLK